MDSQVQEIKDKLSINEVVGQYGAWKLHLFWLR
jgi:hypothetical protein